jgi:poly(A) polymerase
MEYSPGNVAPRILARAEHNVSRKNIDPDALKVLYRLKNHGYVAYLVGGGVRDLLLERQPKDFDIATSAHPQQVKKLFRNCFIVGRRFRLCHVRFGRKVVEVSTFRKQAPPEEGDALIRRDNTFGSPEEDAFRRDFTVNAIFYDIATFSVIDWVGGLRDVENRIIRTIGEPGTRFREDPVRMLRAVSLAARLGFSIDEDSTEAIRALRGEIVRSSPARLLEEFYKVLRQGASRETFVRLHQLGLLAYLLPEADRALSAGGEALLASLDRLDRHRRSGQVAAEDLSNPILVGTLLVPLGVPLRRVPVAVRRGPGVEEQPADEDGAPDDVAAEMEALGESEDGDSDLAPDAGDDDADDAVRPDLTAPLVMPFARRDLDRLRLILAAQRRLREVQRSPGVKHMLAGRGYFDDAVRWLEVHGGPDGRELAGHWHALEAVDEGPGEPASEGGDAENPRASSPDGPRRSRRRRRRRRRPSPPPAPAA